MDAAGNQNAVETRPGCAGDVGAQAVADGKDARAVVDAEQLEAGIVDRTERLPVPANAASGLLVPLRQCAGAESEMVAMHDDEIGIGAHHRKSARQRPPQQRRIILEAVLPARRTGVEDELCLFGGFDKLERQPFADPGIALRSDVQAPPAECPIKRVIAPIEALPGFFSRGHYVVVESSG